MNEYMVILERTFRYSVTVEAIDEDDAGDSAIGFVEECGQPPINSDPEAEVVHVEQIG